MIRILYKDDSRHTKDDSRHTKYDSRHTKDEQKSTMESNSIKKYQCVIPSEALLTKNYREFCRVIAESFNDITQNIQY